MGTPHLPQHLPSRASQRRRSPAFDRDRARAALLVAAAAAPGPLDHHVAAVWIYQQP